MRLPRLAIENHQFTLIIIATLIITGVVSFFTMPRSEDPQVSPAGSSVYVVYPGANPVDMEELVVDPIEESINELEDIKDLNASAEDGLAVISVEFESGSDPDKKYSDVVQKVNSIREKLPADILSLESIKWSVSDVNIIQAALVSDSASYRRLEKQADDLKKRLEKVPGVKRSETWAFPQQEVRISADLEKMAQMHIPLQQVMGAIQSANQIIPGGNIDIGSRRFNIQTSGSYQSLDDLRNTIVHSAGGKIVYLKDVATVTFGYEDESYSARVNGQRAVFVTAKQKEGTNIFTIHDGIKKQLSGFEEQLPPDIHLQVVFDQSKSVSHRVSGFFMNLLQGLILVGLVILLAVDVRASLIVMLVIPFSILIALGFVDLSHYGIQQMSIAGLVIALGLLVDNAIVVTENIARFMKLGYRPKEAAVKGTEQIAWPVVSATLTTVLAFIPIIMMRNITGDFIRSMPVTVIYTLSASLLIALTLTPFLSSKFLKVSASDRETRIRRWLNHQVETRYRRTLDFSLSRPLLVIMLALGIFVVSLGLFPLVGVSFFPKAEKPQLLINVKAPQGTSMAKTDSLAGYVESKLTNMPQIESYSTNIGHGNPRIYYNISPEREKSNHAQIFVQLKKYQPDEFAAFIDTLRNELSGFPGAKIEVKEFEQGPPVEAPIAIRIFGDNLSMLRRISRDVENMIAAIPGTININNPMSTSKTDLHVKIDRAKAGILGVPLVEIDRTVRASIAGLPVSGYRDAEGKEYNITVRLPVGNSPRITDFDKIYVASVTGAQIPLKQIARLEFRATPMIIDHHDLERNVMVTADMMKGYSVDDAGRVLIRKLDNYNWPNSYRYAAGGELESREESFGGMMQAVIIAMLAIFGVLVLQFRSYLQPVIVFAAIPLAIIGSIIALLITGNSFSFTAFVGLTSLVGIVVNNSIILVDYTNQLRAEGKATVAALKEASETRFIPILLTTGTTIGGLLPLTLGGGSLWAPMGWTIIGGLFVSTFLTLIIVPVLYKLFITKLPA